MSCPSYPQPSSPRLHTSSSDAGNEPPSDPCNLAVAVAPRPSNSSNSRSHRPSLSNMTSPRLPEQVRVPQHSPRDRHHHDPEKGSPYASLSSPASSWNSDDLMVLDPRGEGGVKQDTLALLHLTLFAPFLSFAVCIYTFVALFLAAILAPLRLCVPSRRSFSATALAFLRPPLRLQYRCCCSRPRRHPVRSWPGSSPSTPAANASQDIHSDDGADNLLGLAAVHIFSPFVALPLAFAGVVIAFFWCFSAITTNEVADGAQHSGFDDGRTLARGLRRLWVRYLDGRLLDSRPAKS